MHIHVYMGMHLGIHAYTCVHMRFDSVYHESNTGIPLINYIPLVCFCLHLFFLLMVHKYPNSSPPVIHLHNAQGSSCTYMSQVPMYNYVINIT